jgi:hypothetical protein
MSNFEILEMNDEKYSMLVVMKTYEAPFLFLDEIAEILKEQQFRGAILIDELMHSGNNEERFIKGFFDGENFDNNEFSFEVIDRRSEVRKYSCELLKKDPDIIDYSILNEAQKSLINKGVYI